VTSVVASVVAPRGWDWIPFGRLVERSKQAGREDLQPLSVFLDEGVVPRSSREDNFNRLGADMSKYLLVRRGDIVFNKLRTWQGGLGVSNYEGIVSPAYFVCRPQSPVDPRFLHHLLRSAPYLAEFTRISKFMPPSQFDILWQDLRGVPVVLPTFGEQRAIADFLDAETARVDALIAKKRRLIELLDEHHRVLVAGAMAEFRRVPLKRVVAYTEGPGIMADDFHDDGVPLIRVSGVGGPVVTLVGCNFLDPAKVKERWSHFALAPGDRVISASATMGTVSVVDHQAAGAIPYTGLIRFRPRSNSVNMDYVEHFLGSSLFVEQIDLLKTGTAIQHFGPTHLGAVFIPFPSGEVQAEVARTLGRSERLRARTQAAVRSQIALLAERRQALITAAVTGEMTVPRILT